MVPFWKVEPVAGPGPAPSARADGPDIHFDVPGFDDSAAVETDRPTSGADRRWRGVTTTEKAGSQGSLQWSRIETSNWFSPKGAAESLSALLPVLRHALDQLAGGDH